MKRIEVSIIILLALISIQAFLGDNINLFTVFPMGAVVVSLGGFAQALQQAGIAVVVHAVNGFLIIAVSLAVVVFSFMMRVNKLRITSIIGLIGLIVALSGGLLFVFSGYGNNGYSAQMATGFLIAYAFYFIELYFTKGLDQPNRNAGVVSQVVR